MRYSVALLIGVIVLTVGTVTSAQTIEFTFSAPLTKVDPLVENIFTVGDMATIRYSFDASTPVLEPPTETAHYRAIQSLQLAIQLSKGGVYTATASSGVITVSDNISAHGLTLDHYFAGATNQRPLFDLSAPAVNGMTITGVYLSLWDTTAAVFSSLALPLSIDPSEFVPNHSVPLEGISLRFAGPNGPGFVSAALTSLTDPNGPPALVVDRTSLRYAAVTSGGTWLWQTAPQVVRLRQVTATAINWSATPNERPTARSGAPEVLIDLPGSRPSC